MAGLQKCDTGGKVEKSDILLDLTKWCPGGLSYFGEALDPPFFFFVKNLRAVRATHRRENFMKNEFHPPD